MAMADPSSIARLERALLTSWPALSVAFDDDWVIRMANGYTKRANAVSCLGAGGPVDDERIDRIEAIYERHGLPPVFRVSPLAPPALSEALNRRDWRRFDESIVMISPLQAALCESHDLPPDVTVEIMSKEQPNSIWLEACYRIEDLSEAAFSTFSMMLQRLIPDAGYGALSADGVIASIALSVIDQELVGLFDVNTVKTARRQGFSRHLLTRLLRHGRDRGASHGWLSVVADNTAAISLYQSLGFAEVYRYHYRSKV